MQCKKKMLSLHCRNDSVHANKGCSLLLAYGHPPVDANTGAMGFQPEPTEENLCRINRCCKPYFESALFTHTLNIHPECHNLAGFGQKNTWKSINHVVTEHISFVSHPGLLCDQYFCSSHQLLRYSVWT